MNKSREVENGSSIRREWLAATALIDSDHPRVVAFAQEVTEGLVGDRARGVALYHAVRDRIRYNPYIADMSPEGMKASRVLVDGESFCVPKAILLAAAARALGIPSRLAFADVRNHLTSDKLKRSMRGSDLFVFHGQTLLLLDGHWSKSTPAFNLSLCEKAGILPLEYDGLSDSIFHPFDRAGNRHMEYVNDRGTFDDMPYDEFMGAMRQHYGMQTSSGQPPGGAADFEQDAYAGD
ncbi:MAG: transglutaminase family protein [Pseudomonadota bacterium]|nr:transglutaminase family protein [Pseudomonadota bacterium]